MKRLTGFAALLFGVALTLFSGTSGAQTYSTALPHWVSLSVPIVHFNTTNGTGRLEVDSLSAYFETSLVSTATSSDTTIAISLADAWTGINGIYITPAAADSQLIGFLTVSTTTTLGSGDTLHAILDYTMDGKNWVAGTDIAGTATAWNYFVRHGSTAGASSEWQPFNVWLGNPITAQAVGGTTRNTFAGAQAIRFRFNADATMAVALCNVTWTYLSTAPEPGR